jgi:hypothetical protein
MLGITICAACGGVATPIHEAPKQAPTSASADNRASNSDQRKLVIVGVELGANAPRSVNKKDEHRRRLAMSEHDDKFADVPASGAPKPLNQQDTKSEHKADNKSPVEISREEESTVEISEELVLNLVRRSLIGHLNALGSCFDDEVQLSQLRISAEVTELGRFGTVNVEADVASSTAKLCARLELRKLRISNYRYGKRRVVLNLQFQPID